MTISSRLRTIIRQTATVATLFALLAGGQTAAWAQDEPLQPGGEEMPPSPGEEMPPDRPEAVPIGQPAQPAATGAMPAMLAPGSRPFFAGLQLGGAIRLKDAPSQFALIQEFGWHFLTPGSGPAAGVILGESFGDNAFVFRFAPKFWWFFQPVANLGLYVVPFIHMGLIHTSFSFGPYSASSTGFNWGIGAQGRLMLMDRFYVLFQPFALDFSHASGGTGIRWDLLFGGGATF